jgi:hypothetical protein
MDIKNLRITEEIAKAIQKNQKAALLDAANLGVTIIKKRTKASKSISGSPFVKYSPDYEEFRAKKSRPRKPDLNFTGEMFSALSAKGSRKKATIFFTGAAENKKAAKNNIRRPFFGFNESEENRLRKVYENRLLRGVR